MTALPGVGEDRLREMLEVCTDFTKRRQIRAALRELQFGCIPGLLASPSHPSNRIAAKMADKHGQNPELDKKLKTLMTEKELSDLLLSTDNFDDRMKIRAAIREFKKKAIAEKEAAAAAARKNKMAAPKKVPLDLDGIEDEAVLREMLDKTNDAEEKNRIKVAIRDLRHKARQAAEEAIAKEEEDYKRKKHHHQEEHIPALSIEAADKSGVIDFTEIDDISKLEKMLAMTDEFGERSQIRAHIKELREQEELGVPDYPGARRLSEGLDADIWLTEKDRRRSSLIDRAALEELTLVKDIEQNVSYDEIEDPEELERLLENAVDIGEKRLIRGALNDLKKKLAGGGSKDSGNASQESAKSDASFISKPEVRISPSDEEPSTSESQDHVKNSVSHKTESVQEKLDSSVIPEKSKEDDREKSKETLFGSKSEEENEDKENKSALYRSAIKDDEEDKSKDVEIMLSNKSSTVKSVLPTKEKNNNDIGVKSSRLPISSSLSSGKPQQDSSKFSTPSKINTTQKENDRNKKESALSTGLYKFATPTFDSTKTKPGDRMTPSTPFTSKLAKGEREAKEPSSLSSRMSKFNTPSTDTTKARFPGSPASSSKLDSLRSKFSGVETSTHQELRIRDRALKSTGGKVSEAASKFGGSCSGSSCGTTPSQSPIGSPVTRRPFEFGKIHNPSLATTPTPSNSRGIKSEDNSASSPMLQKVPSSKLATSRFETSTLPLASKTNAKTKLEVPLGKEISLELQTSGDKTIEVQTSCKANSSSEVLLPRSETKSADKTVDKTEPLRKSSPTEEDTKVSRDKMPPVDDIEDEEALEKMLESTSEFEERKKIRARLREIRKKKREEMDEKIAAQQKRMQEDIIRSREEGKANRLKAYDKNTPLNKDLITSVSKTPLNNNTIIAPPTTSSKTSTSTTKVEETDGKSKTLTMTSVQEGPGSKTVTTATLSKSEDKDTKSSSVKQETTSVKKEDTPTSSSFSAKSSSVSSSVTTSSSTGTPGTRKLSKFEAEMEEKRKMRELKRAEDEKHWKEYMAKKKQDDMERKRKDIEAAKKKKEALMNKFGGKAESESGGFGRGTGMAAVPNANTIKQKLLEWCQRCARGYPEVQITNFSSSWADGMAFCAIVHYHFPNAFDFDSLDKKNRRRNFDLAFDMAEKHADIMPLLETDDMIMMKNKPDWKCVFTYVQSLYRHLIKLKP